MDLHRRLVVFEGVTSGQKSGLLLLDRFFGSDFVEGVTGGAIFRVEVHVIRAGALVQIAGVAAVVRAAVDDVRNGDRDAVVVAVQKVAVEASALVGTIVVDTALSKVYFMLFYFIDM